MIARLRQATRRDDGASAVEFALLVPVLLLILFGIIAMGLLLFTYITAQHAAREVARQAAVGGFTTCSGQNLPTDVQWFIANKMSIPKTSVLDVRMTRIDPDANGADPGDQLTIAFSVPTDSTSRGALQGITSAIPGGSILLPSRLNLKAETRVEVVGSLLTC